MAISSIGQIIQTAVKNIHHDQPLNHQQQLIAEQLAESIYKNQRNWLPIYVKEISRHNYELIGDPVVLEATRLAEQTVVYCIPVDDKEETVTQILESQKLLFSTRETAVGPSGNGSNLIPVIKRIDSLEQQLVTQEALIKQLSNHVIPDQKLFVNTESSESLKAKLSLISGVGPKTLPNIYNSFVNTRPFYSEVELLAGVSGFHRAQDKKPTKIFQALKAKYELDYSI